MGKIKTQIQKFLARDNIRLRMEHWHNWVQTHPVVHRFLHRGEWVLHCLYFGILSVENWGKAYAMVGGVILIFSLVNTATGEE